MSNLAIDIVKRGKKRPSEKFEPEKLHASIYAALLSVRSPEGLAEDTARRACEYVIVWLGQKSIVTSADLRRKAAEALDTLHPEAAYIYKNYRTII